MGDLIAALKFTEGKYSSNMMKLILLSALAAVALAEPEAHYGYYGYPYYHQLGWPSVRAPGFSSTCWGCRGKRSAEVDNVNRVSGSSPFPSYTAAWPGATVSVNHMGKRSADAEPEADADADAYYGYYGYGGHGYALPGHSYAHFGYGYPYHHYGKRSAEPEPHYGYYGYPYGYYGYPYYHRPLKVVDGAAGVHPGGATSSVSRSPQGLRGKRSADPQFFGYYGLPFVYHPYVHPVVVKPATPLVEDGAAGVHPGGGAVAVGRTVWGAGK